VKSWCWPRHLVQIAVGRRDDAHIGCPRAGFANSVEDSVAWPRSDRRLQHAQELCLHHRIALPHLIQEQRASVGFLEGTLAIGVGAGELESLLIGLDQLPQEHEAETLRSLFRVDARLGDLVQIMGEAGPG
jgi:hypothetical protein